MLPVYEMSRRMNNAASVSGRMGERQFSTLQEFAGARAVNGSGINGQDDGTPQCNLVQQVGSAGTVPQAERGQPVRDGRQVFRRMRPCQGQQAGDAEGQLEGGFPFAGRSRRDDDAMILRNLAQSGDQEFPADDENGNPGGAEPFAVR